jgi:hypothetical protein
MSKHREMVLVLHGIGRDGLPVPILSVIDRGLVETMVREINRVCGVKINCREAKLEGEGRSCKRKTKCNECKAELISK